VSLANPNNLKFLCNIIDIYSFIIRKNHFFVDDRASNMFIKAVMSGKVGAGADDREMKHSAIHREGERNIHGVRPE